MRSSSPANYFIPQNISDVEAILLKDGSLQCVDYALIKDIPQEKISQFCHQHAIYQIVTTELVNWIKEQIGDLKAVEIGAGNGCLGRTLGIPITDSKLQEDEVMQLLYAAGGQPTIKYPDDIIEMNGNNVIKEMKPDVLIGAWITQKYHPTLHREGHQFGIDERFFRGGVQKYIHIGNELTHSRKIILKTLPVQKYQFEWLVSRSMSRDKNIIYSFDCK